MLLQLIASYHYTRTEHVFCWCIIPHVAFLTGITCMSCHAIDYSVYGCMGFCYISSAFWVLMGCSATAGAYEAGSYLTFIAEYYDCLPEVLYLHQNPFAF